jgi:hypothetical protein
MTLNLTAVSIATGERTPSGSPGAGFSAGPGGQTQPPGPNIGGILAQFIAMRVAPATSAWE